MPTLVKSDNEEQYNEQCLQNFISCDKTRQNETEKDKRKLIKVKLYMEMFNLNGKSFNSLLYFINITTPTDSFKRKVQV